MVLFDGRSLADRRAADDGPAKWVIKDGAIESVPGSGYLYSARSFGDVQLHVEWAAPSAAQGRSQGRGNSGVFLMGLYEVQVLDSYGNDTYPDGQAAAIYGQYPPLVNACRPRANGRPTTSGTAIPWRLVPHSERAFSLRYTAGDLEFDLKPDGAVTSLTFRLAGDSHTATRGE